MTPGSTPDHGNNNDPEPRQLTEAESVWLIRRVVDGHPPDHLLYRAARRGLAVLEEDDQTHLKVCASCLRFMRAFERLVPRVVRMSGRQSHLLAASSREAQEGPSYALTPLWDGLRAYLEESDSETSGSILVVVIDDETALAPTGAEGWPCLLAARIDRTPWLAPLIGRRAAFALPGRPSSVEVSDVHAQAPEPLDASHAELLHRSFAARSSGEDVLNAWKTFAQSAEECLAKRAADAELAELRATLKGICDYEAE